MKIKVREFVMGTTMDNSGIKIHLLSALQKSHEIRQYIFKISQRIIVSIDNGQENEEFVSVSPPQRSHSFLVNSYIKSDLLQI